MVLLICVPIQLERSNDEIKIPLFPLSERIPSFYISLLIRIIGFVRVLCIDILFIFMHAHDCVCACVCPRVCPLYCRCTGYSRCPCGPSALFRVCVQVQLLTPSLGNVIFQTQLHLNSTDDLNLARKTISGCLLSCSV